MSVEKAGSTTPPAEASEARVSNAATGPPHQLRQLQSPSALALAGLCATFEDLQTVLRCCERLVTELSGDTGGDEVVVEAAWTTALLSYGRCFRQRKTNAALTQADVTATCQGSTVEEWHQLLLRLREHYSDASANPRERFSVGVAQDSLGAASGIAITSSRQPLVDELTVRQTGAFAFALSTLVNERITAQQEKVFGEVRNAPKVDLENLTLLVVAAPDERH